MRKGHTNNPNGRPKGTPNKATRKVKSTLQKVFDEAYTPEKILEYIEELDDTDKLRFLVQLLPYLAPKHKAEEPEEILAPDFNRVDLSSLNEKELKMLEAIQQKVKFKDPQTVDKITGMIVK